MQLPEGTLEYWDKVYRWAVPEGQGTMTTNFFKRPSLMKRLLDYNFFESTIVEIGCGIAMIGGMLRLLHGGGLSYLATDPSEYACKTSADLFNVKVATAYAHDLPCEDKSIDFVFAFDVLEHIPAEMLKEVSVEMDRILKSDTGKILINNPLGPSFHDPRYDFCLSMEGIAKFARDSNLRIERVENFFGVGPYITTPYQFIAMGRKQNGEATT